MTKTKGELIGTLCFGKEGLEKKDLRKNQLRIPVIKSDKIDKDSTIVTMVKSPKKVSQGKKNRRDGKAFELKVRADLESKGWIVFRNSNDVEFEKKEELSEKAKENLKEFNSQKFKKVAEEMVGMKIKTCETTTILPAIFKQAKSKWNPFTHSPMTLQSGFPDFLAIKVNPQVYVKIDTDDREVIEGYMKKFEEARKTGKDVFTTKGVEIIPERQIQFVECKTNGTLDKVEKEKVEWIKNNLKIPVFVASQDYPDENINLKPTKRKKMIIKYEEK